ncbi:MAG: DUF4097 family beta strand repeat-containing protein [Halanaerobiales bacterium]
MKKKLLVSLIIIAVILIMFLDFRYNGIRIFENFFREFMTDSLRDLTEGNIVLSQQASSAELEVSGQVFSISDDIKELYLNNEAGSIVIRGEDREDIFLYYKLTVYADSEELAESYIRDLSVREDTRGGRLSLKLDKGEMPRGVNMVKVDYNLSVPEALFLNIQNKNGVLRVEKMAGDMVLRNSYEECQVLDIDGQAEINVNYGKVFVRNIKGNTKIKSAYNSQVYIGDIGGDLILDDRYSSKIMLADIDGSLDLDSEFGSLEFTRVRGDVRLRTSFTDLEGREVEGRIKGRMNYGNLILLQVANELELDGSYLDMAIHFKDSFDDYRIYCETQYGDISSNLPFTVEKEKSRQILTGGDGEKAVSLNNINGDIKLFK